MFNFIKTVCKIPYCDNTSLNIILRKTGQQILQGFLKPNSFSIIHATQEALG
jgi:hypothetical protein